MPHCYVTEFLKINQNHTWNTVYLFIYPLVSYACKIANILNILLVIEVMNFIILK